MQGAEIEEHVSLLDVKESGGEEELCSVFSDWEQSWGEGSSLGSEVFGGAEKPGWAVGSGTGWTAGNMAELLDGDRGGGEGEEGEEKEDGSTYRGKARRRLERKENSFLINNWLKYPKQCF